jgi:hypothetical protein
MNAHTVPVRAASASVLPQTLDTCVKASLIGVFLVFGEREKNLINLLYYLSSNVMRGGKECQQRYCFHYQMNWNSLQ